MFKHSTPRPADTPDTAQAPVGETLWFRSRVDWLHFIAADRPTKFTFHGKSVRLGPNEVIVFRGDEEEIERLSRRVKPPLVLGPICLFGEELTQLDIMALDVANCYAPDDQKEEYLDDVSRTRGRLLTGFGRAADRMRVDVLAEVGDWFTEGRVPEEWSYGELFENVRSGIEV